MNSNEGVWNKHAATWNIVTSPLRPADEDVHIYQAAIRNHSAQNPGSALLLGVTPELAELKELERSRLLAVDINQQMISRVWKGQAHPNSVAVCGDWRALPVCAESFDVILGDGAFSFLAFPKDCQIVFHNLARALRYNGLLIVRLYVRPDTQKAIEELIFEFDQCKQYNFHAWKWRMAMVLATSENNYTVALNDIWKFWRQHLKPSVNVDKLSVIESAVMETIERYEHSGVEYTFPTMTAISHCFSPYFDVLRSDTGHYELSECCPILTLRKK